MSGAVLDPLVWKEPGSGKFKIVETTKRTSASERLRVILLDAISLLPVRAAWSDDDGVLVFALIGKGPWLLMVLDHTGEYAPESMIRDATLDGSRPD
ncbi:MAG: hypothetical protein H6974_12825 [Gammaproteobacteria bacterium]|nr:hypothetical protein [Gammaproteobacteria bacterium]